MASDVQAPCVAKTLAAMVSAMHDKQEFHEERFQLSVSTKFWKFIENVFIFFQS